MLCANGNFQLAKNEPKKKSMGVGFKFLNRDFYKMWMKNFIGLQKNKINNFNADIKI